MYLYLMIPSLVKEEEEEGRSADVTDPCSTANQQASTALAHTVQLSLVFLATLNHLRFFPVPSHLSTLGTNRT